MNSHDWRLFTFDTKGFRLTRKPCWTLSQFLNASSSLLSECALHVTVINILRILKAFVFEIWKWIDFEKLLTWRRQRGFISRSFWLLLKHCPTFNSGPDSSSSSFLAGSKKITLTWAASTPVMLQSYYDKFQTMFNPEFNNYSTISSYLKTGFSGI